ncbi:hypothetical protein DFP74_3289 [Nocardiopsis sp. Huas11]|uniref:hypothetical protein n=1 Tax=Nocardiopsis sp. Huas11 TaxID=2183912 RepID=UPI000EAFE4F8|nr:hypothetical protein [Nocardiopsis sp. Huas11]RKS07610.1 hypothetical protein DFP74_3289 [Nocardiopsis sp. Huas11]
MRYLRSVDLEAVRATAARSFHLTRAPEPADPLAIPERAPEAPESVVVSFPDPTDPTDTTDGGTVVDLWERRPLAPVVSLSEHYRHQIRNRGPLRTAAFRSCSCDWVERPAPHRPKHAKHATCEAEHVKPRRRRRASRVRAYVSHPGGDLAPLALAVRSWISMVASGPDGGSALGGSGLGAVA